MLHRPIRNAPVEARIGFLGYQARACGFELEIQREQFTGEKTVVDLDLPEARSMPNALSLRDRLGQAVSSELVVDYSRGLIIHNEGPDLLEVKTWENPVQAQLLAFSHLMCWLRKFPVYPLSYWPIMPQTVAGLHVCMETFVDFTQHQLLENYPAWFQLLSFVVSFLSPGLITKQGERLVLYANNRAHLLLNLVYDVDPLQNLITTRSKYRGYAKPNSRLVHFSCCPPYSATNFFILVTSLHCLLCMIESPNERLKAFLKNPVVDEGPVQIYEDISYELHNYYSQSQHRARITQLIKKLSQHLKFALRQMAETSDGVDRVVFNSLADFYGVVFEERLSELKAVLDFPRVKELFEKNPDISEVLQQLRNMAKAGIESLGEFFPQELLPRHLATFQDVDTSDSLFVGYDPRSRARAVVLYHLKNLLHNFSQASEDHKLVVGRLDIIHRWSSIHVCYRTENQPENPIELANFDLNVLSKAERESLDEEISRLMRMLESNLQKLAG